MIMSKTIRRLGALIVLIAVAALGACENVAVVPPPDCSGIGAIGPASRTVAVNELMELEIEVIPATAAPTVSWSLEQRPLGSRASLAFPNSSRTNSFTPDLPGEYRVSRSVGFSGCGEFNHTATITAVEGPVADASATQVYWDVGATVTLDGTASSANVETWDWNVVSSSNQIAGVAIPPDGSGETFTFVLTEPNIIEYRLVVSAGSVWDGDWVTVRSNPPTISDVTPRSGAIGDRVVIDGANFSPTASNLHNKVTFNGVEASFVSGASASVNRLEVYVPDTATDGLVVVEVRGTGEVAHGPYFTVTNPVGWEAVLDRGQLLNGVHVVDSDIATAVGDIIVRTVNGGRDWITQTTSAGTLTLQDVHFVDANTGYAVGRGSLTGGLVLRTRGVRHWPHGSLRHRREHRHRRRQSHWFHRTEDLPDNGWRHQLERSDKRSGRTIECLTAGCPLRGCGSRFRGGSGSDIGVQEPADSADDERWRRLGSRQCSLVIDVHHALRRSFPRCE